MLLALLFSTKRKEQRIALAPRESRVDGGTLMFGGIFLWLLGVPFSLILLLWLFGVLG